MPPSLKVNISIEKLLFFSFILFLVISSSSKFVIAATTQNYLVENSTWQQNLTEVTQGSLSFGDIDSDGDLDLISSGAGNNNRKSKLYTNNGTSLVENKTWQQNLTGINYGSHMFGDIDNDGDLDLALTGCNRGADAVSACTSGYDLTKIYTNNGTSLVENKSWYRNLTAAYRSSLFLGDIDNDGDLDLALTGVTTFGGGGYIAKVYLNNGTSLVENKKWYQNLTKITDSFIVLGDVNDDGSLDLVLSGEDTSSNKITKVYLNNGTSLVENKKWYNNIHAVNKGALSLGDFDNDADLDLTLIGCCDYHRIYRNNGTAFVEIQVESTAGGNLGGILEGSQALGDYDNDGDLDLITTGREKYTTLYLYNSSASNFTGYTQDPESHVINLEWSSVVWGDLDNDSDLDLSLFGFDTNIVSPRVYTNNITTPNIKPTPPKQFTNYTNDNGNIHLGWGNGSDAETPSPGLYYNLRVGSTSGGNQIISGKYGGGEDNGYFGNMMQRKNITLKSTRLQPNTQYFWSVQTIDTALKASSWSAEKDFTTLGDLTPPVITLNAPVNHYNSSSFRIIFNATVYDNRNVTNVTLYSNWTGNWIANFTNSSSMNNSVYLFDIKLNQEGDDYYIWAIRACDNSSLCRWSDNRTFLIDTHYPNVSLIRPLNNSILTSSSVSFSYNVSDRAISNCSLIIGSVDQVDYSVIPNIEQSFTKSFSNGNYEWNVNCTDTTNHTNMSMIRSFSVSIPSGGGVSHAGKRAYTKPVEKPVIKKEEPVKKIVIKPEHLEEIKTYEEKPKSRIVSFFETIYAFITSLLIILSYIWIIKEDFPKNEN